MTEEYYHDNQTPTPYILYAPYDEIPFRKSRNIQRNYVEDRRFWLSFNLSMWNVPEKIYRRFQRVGVSTWSTQVRKLSTALIAKITRLLLKRCKFIKNLKAISWPPPPPLDYLTCHTWENECTCIGGAHNWILCRIVQSWSTNHSSRIDCN